MKNKNTIERWASPIVMWFIVLAGFLIIFLLNGGLENGGRVFTSVDYFLPDSLLRYAVVPAFLYWIYFVVGALWIHREAAKSVARITKIVRTGVYEKVRHPIYSADIIFAWGIFFYFPNYRILLCASWLSIVLVFWAILEEDLLLEKFPNEYADYISKTSMFVPRFRK